MDDGVNILNPGLDSAPGHHLKLKKSAFALVFCFWGLFVVRANDVTPNASVCGLVA
jgi:hypothetical protein